MADFQRYQPRRSQAGWPWRRIGVIVIGSIVVVAIGRGLFGGDNGSSNRSGNENPIRLVNENKNAAVNAEPEPATNTSAETASLEAPSADSFSLEPCTGAVSQYGNQQVLALTFNVVANNQEVRALIDLLKKEKIPASWFVTGSFAETSSALVGDIATAGFGVYNRSYDNPHLTNLSVEQITEQLGQAERAISAATGRSSKPFLRPPFGDSNAAVVDQAKAQGYCTILWSVDAFDWQSDATAASSSQRVIDKFRPGAVIMFSAGYDVTADAVELVIKAAKSDNYQFVSLVDLFKS